MFVGEQASGKSILLQLMKLISDAGNITQTLKKHGFDWQKKSENFFVCLFWRRDGTDFGRMVSQKSLLIRKIFTPRKALARRKRDKTFFLIPAHRVLTLKDGWPRSFTDYATSDPYVVKEFSEELRLLMEAGLGSGKGPIFPQGGRMNKNAPRRDRKKHLWRR